MKRVRNLQIDNLIWSWIASMVLVPVVAVFMAPYFGNPKFQYGAGAFVVAGVVVLQLLKQNWLPKTRTLADSILAGLFLCMGFWLLVIAGLCIFFARTLPEVG